MDTKLQGNHYGEDGQDLIEDGQATEEADALSLKLGREVQLIWNRTEGGGNDLTQAIGDRLWQPIVPQINPATRQLAGILLRHAERGENVSLCAHSHGNLIVRNALRTLYHLGHESWVRDQVRWVGAGSPLTHIEVEFPVHFTRVLNVGDPINAIGQTQEMADAGRENPFGKKEHSMIRSYVAYMAPSMFWLAGNDYKSGSVPLGVDPALYAKHQSIWAARAGLKPIVTKDATLEDVVDTVVDVMFDSAVDSAVEAVVDNGLGR